MSDCGGDAAAYVLGALEPGEAEEFRKHMEGCVVCRDEVGALQHVADALPMSAPADPLPRGLRRRVLAEVRADARGRTRADIREGTRAAAALRSRPALAAGVAAVAAVAAAIVVAVSSSGSPVAHVFRASVGDASVRVAGGRAELIVDRLPATASGHIYEVWLQRGDRPPTPTNALFGVTSAGAADVDVPGDLKGVSEVLVTQEPAGGSPHPTTAPVIVAHIA